VCPLILVRKHRAPNGALRRVHWSTVTYASGRVRKHRAPNGALRRQETTCPAIHSPQVRKHRAPNGALRLAAHDVGCLVYGRQKAPSAKRCIKTRFG